MTVLVLAAGGMLGHKVWQVVREAHPDAWCTLRGKVDGTLARTGLFQRNVLEGVDALGGDSVLEVVRKLRPMAVVNCLGVIKQRSAAQDPIPSITVNALLPHLLARTLSEWGGRLVHFSTDCVFSGSRGDYSERDPSDAEDLYGKTKFLGEVATANALTLRTSIIGRELSHHASLVDWFLAQRGSVRGFSEHWYSGVPTVHLARIVLDIIDNRPNLHGLYQVTSPKISKFELLRLLRAAFAKEIDIEPDPSTRCDRSMSGALFDAAVGRSSPNWSALVAELAEDAVQYREWVST